MSVSFGFYNSNNHDRVYDTRQFSRLFNALIKDGVFMHIGSHFEVTAGSGMTVNVGTGYAWFNSTWTLNDAPLPIAPEESDLLLTRIDALVLEVDETAASRTNSIKFVKGTPSAQPQKPSLTNTNDIHQYALAYITIAPGAESLSQSNIENNIGKESCPFVTGILETIDISSLISQWEAQWNEWLEQQKQETDEFQKTSEEQFSTWFEHIKGQLGEDAAGNLQNQIDDITPQLLYKYKAFFDVESWASGSGEYTQTANLVAVNGGPSVTETSEFMFGVSCEKTTSSETNEALQDTLTLFQLGYSVSGSNQITAHLFEKPTSDIEVIWTLKEGNNVN